MVNKKPELIDDFTDVYRLFSEVTHNREKQAYIGLINKLKSESKPPIKHEYVDLQNEVDDCLRYFKKRMLRLIRFKEYL